MATIRKGFATMVSLALALALVGNGVWAYAQTQDEQPLPVIEEQGDDEGEGDVAPEEDLEPEDATSDELADDEVPVVGEQDEPDDEVIEDADDVEGEDPADPEDPVAPEDPAEPVEPVPADDEQEEPATPEDEQADDPAVVDDDAEEGQAEDEEKPSEDEDESKEEETETSDDAEKDGDDSKEEEKPTKPRNTHSGTFTDVPTSHWAHKVIKRAAKLGLIEGYSGDRAGMFGPDDGITRAQVVVILWRMAGKPEAGEGAKDFSDVKSGDYFYKAVRWASEKKVVAGYTGDREGQFGPNDPVQREQLAAMMTSYASRIAGLESDGGPASYAAMTDAAQVSSWAESSVGWCYTNGLMTGSGGKVKPQDGATRAEASKMILGLYDRVSCEWQLNVSTIYSYVRTGTEVFFMPAVTGTIPGELSFSYTATRGSSITKLDSTYVTLSDPGRYLLTAKATDGDGHSQAGSVSVMAYGLQSLKVSDAGNDTWKAEAQVGLDDAIPYMQYKFTWNKVETGEGGVIQDWTDSRTATFDKSVFGGVTGTIEIAVEAWDDYGSLGTMTKTITVQKMDDMTTRAQSFYSDTDYLIMADCWWNWVGVYEGHHGNWTRIKHFRCSSGAPWSPTIKGTFTVQAKGFSFGDGTYTCYYYTQFYGDYLFHSVLYDAGTFNIQDGRLGESISHGCVRMAIEDAKWIWDNVPYGSTVHTY